MEWTTGFLQQGEFAWFSVLTMVFEGPCHFLKQSDIVKNSKAFFRGDLVQALLVFECRAYATSVRRDVLPHQMQKSELLNFERLSHESGICFDGFLHFSSLEDGDFYKHPICVSSQAQWSKPLDSADSVW